MLTALLIIAILMSVILILILCSLLFPMVLHVKLQNTDLTLTLRILGIPFRLYPKKPRLTKHKSSSKNNIAPKQSVLPALVDTTPQTILSYAKALLEEITRFTKCCTTKLLQLTVIPPDADDAATAALCHTAVSGSVAAILELLDQNTHLVIYSPTAIDVRPNFTNEKASVTLHLTLQFPPYRALMSLTRLTERLQNI